MDNRPIGVFDYGPGGLEAVRLLSDSLPDERFIYFADDARAVKSEPFESARRHRQNDARQYADFLVKKDVKAIVIACNLMSAFSGDILKEEISVPTTDLLSAGAYRIRQLFPDTNGRRIAVLTTEMAAQISLFQHTLSKVFEELETCEMGCSELFELRKRVGSSENKLRDILRSYWRQIGGHIDAVYLACTRFSSVAEEISEQMDGAPLVDPIKALPELVDIMLKAHDLRALSGQNRSCTIYTTGDIDAMLEFSTVTLGDRIPTEVYQVRLNKEQP